jgi:hypothetical protein
MKFDAPPLSTGGNAATVDAAIPLSLALEQPLETLHVVCAALATAAATFAFAVLHFGARASLLIDACASALPGAVHGLVLL